MRCASLAIGERVGALALILTASGCGVLAPLEGTPPCADYATVVQPVLTADCVSCHGPTRAEGGYRLDSRAAGIALRDDGTSRVTGASPALLAAASGTLSGHPAVSLADGGQDVLAAWVTCKGAAGPAFYHPAGWATPGAETFHGLGLRATGYQLAPCQKCHGADLDGGAAQVACTSCHTAGVNACNTCHGSGTNPAPPRNLSGAHATTTLGVGAHQAHVTDGPLHKAYGCDACHAAVTQVQQESHFPQDGGAVDGIAEVKLAAGGWTRDTATCAGTTCHAAASDGTHTSPVWTKVGQGEAACGACHGTPPAAPHPQDSACARCHPANAADGGVLAAAHADGVVQLGHTRPDGGLPAAVPTCDACHANGPGFSDTLGRVDFSLPTVGLHDVHLRGVRKLTRALTCGDCHLVPAAVNDPGHLTAPVEVFPAGSSALARSDSATPAFTPATATCANIYCHGAGTLAANDGAASRIRTWPWTSGTGLNCGNCHGVPPATANHQSAVGLTSCRTCHGSSIDATGKLLTTLPDGGVGMNHLNGVVDFNQ